MSGNGKGRPPLVADKRRPKSTSKAKSKTTSKRTAKPKRAKKVSRNPIVWLYRLIMRLVWGIGWRVTALTVLLLGGAVLYYAATLPPVGSLLDGRARGSVTLLDRNGQIFAWRGEQFGGQITTENVSPYLKDALLATEDKRFYWHPGVDPIGIASAVRINLREGRGPLQGHGGSTITQQTAKLLCLGNEFDPTGSLSEAEYEADCRRTTLIRKAKEAVYAMAMELRYSKEEILTIYMNRVFLGAGSRGFEAAAQRYFGRSANELLPAEAAMLAGLLVAPTRYAPTANLQRSRDRANLIIGLMEEQGRLTTDEASFARANPAELSEAAEARAGGYFADWVMDLGPGFLTEETTEDVVIRTTFDQDIQTSAEEALQWVFDNKVREGSEAQAAIVVMSADGAVRAMVGGRKFKGVAGQFNRAIQAKRQTGSAFKPFVYSAALDLGFSPNDMVRDEPYCLDVPGSGEYCPKNFDRKFLGPITLADALAGSRNVPAVKVLERVGREAVVNIANDFGIESDLAVGPALALGTSESTLLEMTGAYAGILNGGSSVEPYGLVELRLKGDNSPLLVQEGGIGERVITESAARQLIYMMSEVVQRGTGTRARLDGRPAAGKSGTTQAARDAWFIGFTADYVAGVWMGYDDNTPLTGVTGGGLPAEIWKQTMLRLHEGLPVRALPMEIPAPKRQVATERRSQPRSNQGDNIVERVILDVLGEIFGN
ncbi:MAG: transglycosylase domain-containing protein [Boseongicola sp.]|nr:transglycosylase domain-containing protein [Boseongicola sp.]